MGLLFFAELELIALISPVAEHRLVGLLFFAEFGLIALISPVAEHRLYLMGFSSMVHGLGTTAILDSFVKVLMILK